MPLVGIIFPSLSLPLVLLYFLVVLSLAQQLRKPGFVFVAPTNINMDNVTCQNLNKKLQREIDRTETTCR